MQTIQEPARQIPCCPQNDVLVVGSGPAGWPQRSPQRAPGPRFRWWTVLVAWVAISPPSGVEGFAWYRHEQTVEAGGIGMEFETRAKDMGAARAGKPIAEL